ncbi:hypothetical protein LWM68_14300 [Niabella sp. W65]|nr:hypothetical protein [Niabella sp. W65]MCH7363818.1 hypothetical protein [Niabella sp. W65]ULT39725.1 hypothetical protein KRR40_33135 [Niabella sp. I65]
MNHKDEEAITLLNCARVYPDNLGKERYLVHRKTISSIGWDAPMLNKAT